jgi:hypothetical protein
MDPDDDIIPGCYIIDIGIEGLDLSKIWIRADYIRISYGYTNTSRFVTRSLHIPRVGHQQLSSRENQALVSGLPRFIGLVLIVCKGKSV